MDELLQFVDLFQTLGVTAPLVGILFYLLRQANQERQGVTATHSDMQSKNLDMLTKIVELNAKTSTDNAAALRELTGGINASIVQHTKEHEVILKLVTKSNGNP